MPIPFRDADELEELGAAAYLTIVPRDEGGGFEGALFVINARGEPLEFTYNRLDVPHTFLWREEDIRRHVQRRLVASLFSICPVAPSVIFCRADEVSSQLFCEDIQVTAPVCRVAPASDIATFAGNEAQESAGTPEALNLFWFPGAPAESTTERRIVDELAQRGLLLEPFARAKAGLDEVYGRKQGPAP